MIGSWSEQVSKLSAKLSAKLKAAACWAMTQLASTSTRLSGLVEQNCVFQMSRYGYHMNKGSLGNSFDNGFSRQVSVIRRWGGA